MNKKDPTFYKMYFVHAKNPRDLKAEFEKNTIIDPQIILFLMKI